MAPKKIEGVIPRLPLGVEVGEEINVTSPGWFVMQPQEGYVMEVCFQGSSFLHDVEEWGAVLIHSAEQRADGWLVTGLYLGGEVASLHVEAFGMLADGGVHLCGTDPCTEGGAPHLWHATRVRFWLIEQFEAWYLDSEGSKALKKAVAVKAKKEKAFAAKAGPKVKTVRVRARRATVKPDSKRKASPPPAQLILDSEDEAPPLGFGREEDGEDLENGSGMSREQLKAMLAQTKARLLGGKAAAPRAVEASSGGKRRRIDVPAPAEKRLVAGATLKPRQSTVLALPDAPHTKDGGLSDWMSKLGRKTDFKSQLLAQAVQSAEKTRKNRKEQKKTAAERLVSLLQGKDKQKGQRKKKKSKGTLKPDPDDPGDSGGEDGSSSSDDPEDDNKDESDSESSLEAPLKKKAQKRPGSVMQMLVTLAQQQLDQGALLDGGDEAGVLTGGVKIATYFGLLIRPFYAAGNPLLRELYSLSQVIEWAATGGGRRVGSEVHCLPYSSDGWVLEHGSSVGASPIGAPTIHDNVYDVGRPEAQALGAEKPGVLSQPALAESRKRKELPAEREREERRHERQGKRPRPWLGKRIELAATGQRRSEPLEGEQRGGREEMRGCEDRRKDEERASELAKAVLEEAQTCMNEVSCSLGEGLVESVACGEELDKSVLTLLEPFDSLRFLRGLVGHCSSLVTTGRAVAWALVNGRRVEEVSAGSMGLRKALFGKIPASTAMHQGRGKNKRALFPLPLEPGGNFHELALRSGLAAFCSHSALDELGRDAWLLVTVCGMNGVAGYDRAPIYDHATAAQKRALGSIASSLERVLKVHSELRRTPEQVEKELSSRFLSYTGEEIPKMQVINFEGVCAALPPESHGGSIDATTLVSEGTREFLLNPENALLDERDVKVKLQAKVHVEEGQQLPLAKVLVKRRICVWVPEEEVLEVAGQKVLNGLFAVGKGTHLPSGQEVQRLIMNLVPSNSVLDQIKGATADLPGITQYLSLVLEGNEKLVFYQSDMSAAFYLFRIPSAWHRMLAFGVCVDGSQVGLQRGQKYYLACNVIPMGWSSAVSVMQEVADRLTTIGGLPRSHQVRKTAPIPSWLVDVLNEGADARRSWYHVYLDNFCSMEKFTGKQEVGSGALLHSQLERAWNRTGVLSSEKKRVSGAAEVQELGASFEGVEGTMGPSPLRILKLIQTTLVVIGAPRLKHKWIQVVAGRWVHVLSFRRPGMVCLDQVWKYISQQFAPVQLEGQVREWLLLCGLAVPYQFAGFFVFLYNSQ